MISNSNLLFVDTFCDSCYIEYIKKTNNANASVKGEKETTMTNQEILNEIQWLKSQEIEACEEILSNNNEIDPEVIEGIVAGEIQVTDSLKSFVIERMDDEEGVGFEHLSAIVLASIDWEKLTTNWLEKENAVTFSLSNGKTLIVWRY